VRRFDYHAPTTLGDAGRLLIELEGASLFAGGTDLFVEIREGLRRCDHAIDLKRIAGLDELSFHPVHGLRVGALATVREIETAPFVRARYPDLAAAARSLGSIQVRNRATLVGNICRASPSADCAPPLIAGDATIVIQGMSGERRTAIEEFFSGPGKTALRPGEIATRIEAPPPLSGSGRCYLKLGRRRAMELATVGVAVMLRLDGERCEDVLIALGAVAPTPMRARGAEAVLKGRRLTAEGLAEAAAAAMAECAPIGNVRASADYRREMVGVLLRRAVEAAREAANDR
jgi:carbon-monoxide dehydrogenase medium subunit